MASKTVFKTKQNKTYVRELADVLNNAGGKAYSRKAEEAVAQFIFTGCFNDTYYVTGENQLQTLLELLPECRSDFLPRAAIAARKSAQIKDTPAFITAYIVLNHNLFGKTVAEHVFNTVIDNGKMLRNFCQMIRSGVFDKKSFGSFPKLLIQNWLNLRDPDKLFQDSIGNDPSIRDVIRMVHPKANTKKQNALFRYIVNGTNDRLLPKSIRDFESWKLDRSLPVPNVNFQRLSTVTLSAKEWETVADNMNWQTLRMNLNTLQRNGVFNSQSTTSKIAQRLADANEVRKSNVLPHQLFAAYNYVLNVPKPITNALQEALDHSLSNVPSLPGNVYIFLDISGSMSAPVTGKSDVASKISCRDAGAVFACAMLRKNKNSTLWCFSDRVTDPHLNPLDSVATNIQKIARLPSGGTNCSLPLAQLNQQNSPVDTVIFLSDNESWMDSVSTRQTAFVSEWNKLKKRCPNAKMVCVDLCPNTTIQSPNSDAVMNIGGFSNGIFDLIEIFMKSSGKIDWSSLI